MSPNERSDKAFDLSRPLRVHVVGVGGAGMSAIASVLQAMGHHVTGSDLKWSASTDRLSGSGIPVVVGHEASNLGDAEVVTTSTAVAPSNAELTAARDRGIPVLSRAEMLGAICSNRRTIAVSGTHGKTTTTSMLALILVEAGLRPSFLIGGDVNEIGSNAVWDSGEWLVVEADESDGTFLVLDPDIAVVTNVEPDHLDHYGTFDGLVAAFDRFCSQRPLGVVASADDPVAAGLGARYRAELVGTGPSASWRIDGVQVEPAGVSFALAHDGQPMGRMELPINGAKIAQNAAVAVAAATMAGAPIAAARRALARFTGVARRFERKGTAGGVTFIDDYAHLPSEVAAVLEAARSSDSTRSSDSNRVVAVFQPHRYSRTASLGTQFAHAFDGADVVVVTEVFAAGEAPVPGVTGRVVADAVSEANPGLEVRYVPGRAELGELMRRMLRRGDLCLTLGAGDLTSLADELMAEPNW